MGTDYLFARPSFLSGMASALDMGAILVREYNRSATPNEADFKAIRSDWAITGMDILAAKEGLRSDVKK